MTLPRENKKDLVPRRRETRDRVDGDAGAALLRAARQVFREVGYRDATVEGIILKAKTSRATFYAYFPNKRAAFLRVADALMDEMFVFTGRRFPVEDETERMILSIASYLALWAEESSICADFYRLSIIDPEFSERYSAHQRQFERRLARRYERFAASGQGSAALGVNAELRAVALFAMAQHFAFRFFTRHAGLHDYEFTDAVRTLIEIAVPANYGWSVPVDFPYEEYGLDNSFVREHVEKFRRRLNDT